MSYCNKFCLNILFIYCSLLVYKVLNVLYAGSTMIPLLLLDPLCCLSLWLYAFCFHFLGLLPLGSLPLVPSLHPSCHSVVLCAISGCGFVDCRVCISFVFASWRPAHHMSQRTQKIFLVRVEIKGHNISQILFLAHNHALECREMKFSVNIHSKFPV